MSQSSALMTSETEGCATSELRHIAGRLREILENHISGRQHLSAGEVPFPEILTPLVRLYGSVCEATGKETVPVTPEATPTEVVMMACALLRAQDLNPFDLALWFSRANS